MSAYSIEELKKAVVARLVSCPRMSLSRTACFALSSLSSPTTVLKVLRSRHFHISFVDNKHIANLLRTENCCSDMHGNAHVSAIHKVRVDQV